MSMKIPTINITSSDDDVDSTQQYRITQNEFRINSSSSPPSDLSEMDVIPPRNYFNLSDYTKNAPSEILNTHHANFYNSGPQFDENGEFIGIFKEINGDEYYTEEREHYLKMIGGGMQNNSENIDCPNQIDDQSINLVSYPNSPELFAGYDGDTEEEENMDDSSKPSNSTCHLPYPRPTSVRVYGKQQPKKNKKR